MHNQEGHRNFGERRELGMGRFFVPCSGSSCGVVTVHDSSGFLGEEYERYLAYISPAFFFLFSAL